MDDWPLPDVLSRLGFCARINCPFIALFPPALLTRLQYDCTTIAQYSTPLRPPGFKPYTIQYCAWQYRVKAKWMRCADMCFGSAGWYLRGFYLRPEILCLKGHECRRARVRVQVCECVRVRERRPQSRLAWLAESRTRTRNGNAKRAQRPHRQHRKGAQRRPPHTQSDTPPQQNERCWSTDCVEAKKHLGADHTSGCICNLTTCNLEIWKFHICSLNKCNLNLCNLNICDIRVCVLCICNLCMYDIYATFIMKGAPEEHTSKDYTSEDITSGCICNLKGALSA